MHVLFICSGNDKKISPFIKEQEKSLEKEDVKVDYYKITGNGVIGYLGNYKPLKATLKNGNYDLIHAHYGLSGLLAALQNIVPTVITFHGSDVNNKSNRVFSFLASRLSQYNILVNKQMAGQLLLKNGYSIIPCGVDFDLFYPMNKKEVKNKLGLESSKKYILFSSSFDNPVKNYSLAKEAVQLVEEPVELVELKNKSRKEVSLLFNACDLLLMTSFTEGSPQVVKEALACHTPVVSTDVGDVRELLDGVNNCFITSYNSKDIAVKIKKVLNSSDKIESCDSIQRFDQKKIAQEIKSIYTQLK